jgi:hypothetical protein
MKTYRVEVFGDLTGIYCHLYGRENLTRPAMLAELDQLLAEGIAMTDIQVAEETAE